jgi:hypothetical protein
MEINTQKKARGKNFSKDDIDLLVELTSKFTKIINNKDTNKVSSQLKQKAWVNITNSFNYQSPSGIPRKAEELINKYRNLKRIQKASLAKEKKQLKATGGGPFVAGTSTNIFGISESEIVGIPNIYDSNGGEIEVTEYEVPPGYEVSMINMTAIYCYSFSCFDFSVKLIPMMKKAVMII